VLALLLALAADPARAAFEDLERGARPLALGGAHAALADDSAALFWNPAGMRLLSGGEVVAEVARPFGLRNLDQMACAVVQPTLLGSFGVGVTTLGRSDYYVEKSLRLAFARELHDRFLVGASVALLGLDIRPTYGADWGPSIDLGLLYRTTDRIRLGATLRHANGPSIGAIGIEPGRAGRLGIAFDVERGILLAADLAFEEGFPARLHVGQELRVHEMLALRAGIAATVGDPESGYSRMPMTYSLGFGARVDRVRLDYAFVDHPSLGGTQRLGLVLRYGSVLGGPPARFRAASSRGSSVPDQPIDLNTAGAEELDRLPGVGPVTAQRILEHRAQHGLFGSVDELTEVKGIGPATLEKIRPHAFVSEPDP